MRKFNAMELKKLTIVSLDHIDGGAGVDIGRTTFFARTRPIIESSLRVADAS
jgi:hypothetical protein